MCNLLSAPLHAISFRCPDFFFKGLTHLWQSYMILIGHDAYFIQKSQGNGIIVHACIKMIFIFITTKNCEKMNCLSQSIDMYLLLITGKSGPEVKALKLKML